MLAVVCAGLSWYTIRNGHRSFDAGSAPEFVHVTQNDTYEVSVAGGMQELLRRTGGATVASCSFRTPDSGSLSTPVGVQLYGTGTKATHGVASFIAPITGDIALTCMDWGPVFIDDADSAGFDTGTLLLVLTSVFALLTVGFGLSVLHTLSGNRAAARTRPRGGSEELLRREDSAFVQSVRTGAASREPGEDAAGHIVS